MGPAREPQHSDGRTWVLDRAEDLCHPALRRHFRPGPTPRYPLGDSLTYDGPWTIRAAACLAQLQPARLTITILPEHITSWTWLRHLIIRQVSDAGLARLSALTSLQQLYLRGTQVSDAGLAHLSALSSLQNLHLGGTRVTDAGLTHLSALSSLQTLDLAHTQVSDAGLAHLSALSSLQTLGILVTHVSDPCPTQLPQLHCHR